MFWNDLHSKAVCRVSLLIVFGLGLLSLPGCVKSTPTPEPVTVSFAFPSSDKEYYQKVLTQFNQVYPHITVELQARNGDMLGGIGPGHADVFLSSQFAQVWLKEQGNILNLTPFTEQDSTFKASDFYPGTLDLYTSEGQLWGVPAGVDLMVMYYNQELFDQNNVSYPRAGWTWDDFLQTAMLLRDPETQVFGYMSGFGPFDALIFIYQHGGRIFDDLQKPTRTTFDDPLTIEALEWYSDLVFKHNVSPTQEQIQEAFGSQGDLQSGVQLGRVGMWTGLFSERDSPWMEDLQVGIVPLPVDKQFATLTLIEGYFISSRTEHADACWKWIAFLSQQPPTRSIPVRKSLLESKEFERQAGENVAAIVRASMENALLLSPELAQFEQALNTFTQAFDTIMTGRSEPLEAMTWAQQESKLK